MIPNITCATSSTGHTGALYSFRRSSYVEARTMFRIMDDEEKVERESQ